MFRREGYVYLVQAGHWQSNQFKVGMTSQPGMRFYKYGDREKLRVLRLAEVPNHAKAEGMLKRVFRQQFSQWKGYEYFEGDEDKICVCFDDVLAQYALLDKIQGIIIVKYPPPESETNSETRETSEVETDRGSYEKLRYTNPIAQQIQECLFSDKFFIGMAKLFLLLNKVYVDPTEDVGKFSIFDEDKKLWRTYRHRNLYGIFSTSTCNFITAHIEDLEEYEERVSQGAWRYSEVYTTDCLNREAVDKDSMERWDYWPDTLLWQAGLRDSLRFVLEDVDDPMVYHSLHPDCQDKLTIYADDAICTNSVDGSKSDTTSSNCTVDYNLADRYVRRYIYLFNKDYIYKPEMFASDDVVTELRYRLDRQIVDLKRIRKRLTKNFSMTRNPIVDQILALATHEDLSPNNSKDGNTATNSKDCYLVAIADQKVLDLTTLQVTDRNSEHAMTVACEQSWDGNYTVEEIDLIMRDLCEDSTSYQYLMSILGLALLSMPAPHNNLYIISAPQSVRTSLKTLLSSTLGDLYYEGKTGTLIKQSLDVEDFNQMKGRRMIVFDTSRLSQVISKGVLDAYFNAGCHTTIGGKQYNTNSSFILLVDKTPPIDKLLLSQYASRNLVYYIRLNRLNLTDIANANIDNFHHMMFANLVLFANACYDCVLTVGLLPPPLPTEPLVNDDNREQPVKKQQIYKSLSVRANEQELLSSFMSRRVIIAVNRKQWGSDFCDNFYTYLREIEVDLKPFSRSTVGRYLASYSKNKAHTNIEVGFEEISGKSHRVYLGLESYSYDVRS